MGTEKLPFEDAAVVAALEFKMMKRLESGEECYKSIRERVAAAVPAVAAPVAPAVGLTTSTAALRASGAAQPYGE